MRSTGDLILTSLKAIPILLGLFTTPTGKVSQTIYGRQEPHMETFCVDSTDRCAAAVSGRDIHHWYACATKCECRGLFS